MRLYRASCLFIVLVRLALPAAGQTIFPSPQEGVASITIVTAPALPGDQMVVHTAPRADACTSTAAVLHTAPYTSSVVLAGGITMITLASPPVAKQVLCVTASNASTSHTGAAVLVGAAPAVTSGTPPFDSSKGTPLPASSNVSSSVAVTAVLIPSESARRIFGKQISDRYAVVQLTIANHNPDAALILQSASLDYSHWLFSNRFRAPVRGVENIETSANEAANSPQQIASAESRLVRGQLQDAQSTSARNLFIAGLTAVGSIASGFQFLTVDPQYLRGISTFGNQAVPALAVFWPDRTQLQLNRISDFGFTTNHVIPKGASDIVIAFFPIADFLTPVLAHEFLKSPAVFAVPGTMLLDRKHSAQLVAMLMAAGVLHNKETAAVVSTALAHYEDVVNLHPEVKPEDFSSCGQPLAKEDTTALGPLTCRELSILTILSKASINNIRLVVGGVMTVDISTVPANLSSISVIDGSRATTWRAGSKVSGVVAGSFLTGAQIKLATPVAGIGDFTVTAKTSTDKQLSFTSTITADIAEKTKLTFVLTKTGSDNSTSTSMPYDYVVTYDDTLTLPRDKASWTPTGTAGSVSGTVAGTGLTGAMLRLDNPPSALGQPNVVAAADGLIRFTLPLTAPISSGTQLTFTVIREDGGNVTPGQPISYTVQY